MKRSWWHIVKHVLFGLHSPSLLGVNRCWCQRHTQRGCVYCLAQQGHEEWCGRNDGEQLRRASEAAWKGWGE